MRSFFSKQTIRLDSSKKVAVVIPWRETESRILGFNNIIKYYDSVLDSPTIFTTDSKSEIFNLAASRNLGMKQAFDQGFEAVVLSDADIFVSADVLIESINHSLEHGVIVNPYNLLIELTKTGTEMFFNKEKKCLLNYSWKTDTPKFVDGNISSLVPCAGINIVPKSVWDIIGGFDENFVGWGYEDMAYLTSYIKHFNNIYRFEEGIAISLFHEKEWKMNSKDNENYFKEKYAKQTLT